MRYEDTQKIELNHDQPLTIYVGKHKGSATSTKKDTTWGKILQKCSATTRTAETQSEYFKLSNGNKVDREKADDIKDVGWFFTGALVGGKRKSGTVLTRNAACLDADSADTSFIKALEKVFGNHAYCFYTTHKHSPANPRYRVIIPFDRDVSPGEYEAIARKLAEKIGIDFFDKTTFQPTRMMYWPSASKDAEFHFGYNDADFINADNILAEYSDWKNREEWPLTANESKEDLQRGTVKKDPTTIDGLVGAFCRAYDIQSAITKFLQEVYSEGSSQNRFSYSKGSTYNGLVVYPDNNTCFSNHSTDPAGNGHSHNAFDLVRIHMFGELDEKSTEKSYSKLASYKAMIDLASKDAETLKEHHASALEDFESPYDDESAEQDLTEVLNKLEVDNRGDIKPIAKNILSILLNDPYLKGKPANNLFTGKRNIRGAVPWDNRTKDRECSDDDLISIENYLSLGVYNLQNTAKVQKILVEVFRKNEFHPVRDYFNRLEWDGKERLDRLFIDYLGAENNKYTKAVTRKAITACVARIFNPGCKFDYVLTLVGDEGKYKSTLLRKLGREWFSDTFDFSMLKNGKQAYEQLQGFMLIEIGEMAGHKKAEDEAQKRFITSTHDNYRSSYSRETLNRPRQCVFFGTTNNKGFLISITGNRRFWPVLIGVAEPYKKVADLKQDEIDQIWAEAVDYFKKGESLYLSEELEADAKKVQKSHTEMDERAGIVQEYLDTLLPDDWHQFDLRRRRDFLNGEDDEFITGTTQRNYVCAAEIWTECFRRDKVEMNNGNTKPIHTIMRNMEGWKEAKKKIRIKPFGLTVVYERKKKVQQKKPVAQNHGSVAQNDDPVAQLKE